MKNKIAIVILLLGVGALCTSCAAQTTSSGGVSTSGSGSSGTTSAGTMTGENSYCQAGTGLDKTEGTPTWGAMDGVAQLPVQCMNTALTSTPSPGSTIVASDTAGLTAALSSVACGQTIQVTAGQTYSGAFTFPNLSCDGAHWITVKTSGTIPSEGTRITPCYSNITSEPGYPAYSCTSPSAQTAKITTTDAKGGVQFASGANHYRFIGIEITKQTDTKLSDLISLPPDSDTMGANHIIFDRCVIHGQPWTLASSGNAETGKGLDANNSQYVALINSWDYDTYCNGGCIDSQGFASSTGLYASGPFKLYNNLIASSGETWMFGGGGKGIGTPNTDNIEIRSNHSFKPVVWMIPVDTQTTYTNEPTVKNLGEFKAGTHVLIEGNVFENNWQGQSDQTGFALLLDPRNQNNKASINVDFDGTTTITKTGGIGNFIHTCGNDPNCRPDDAANCPPGGCILEIHDVARPDYNVAYRFCNGTNGCTQTGDLVTTASLTQAPPVGTAVSTYSCVPGDCPSCRVNNVVVRYNEIYNTTMGLEINTALSSHCKDEAKELAKVEIRDNLLHGLSVEMSNGSDPYSYSSAFVLGNGQLGSIINTVDIGHNTVAIETGAETSGTASMGGLGQQVDYTDAQYLQGFNIHDNVAPAAWHVNHTNGSTVTKGVGDAGGLANVFQTDACQPYYPIHGIDVVSGTVVNDIAAHEAFTFSPALGSYMVTKNGSNADLDSFNTTGFTLTVALVAGDVITVRDLNTCNWKFMGNVLGTGMAGNLHVKDQSPYPNNKDSQNYVLDAATFLGIFSNWQDRSGANYSITNPTYEGIATDTGNRQANGKNPGVDLVTWNGMVAGVRTSAANLPLSITTTTLQAATHGITYQGALATTAGASPYKSWWLETDAAKCGGNCGSLGSSGLIIGRSGVVNGPFIVLTASRSGNVSTFTPKQTMVAGTWQVGQSITLTGFTDGSGNQANDGSFNGTCTITAVTTNNFSCGENGVDIASHTANSASMVSFAPIAPGTYTFWMGARDGAFQQARGAITVTVN